MWTLAKSVAGTGRVLREEVAVIFLTPTNVSPYCNDLRGPVSP